MQPGNIVGTAEDIACCERILQLYPWQVFNFRVGAWIRRPRKSKSLFTGERFQWKVGTGTPLQLLVEGAPVVDFEPGIFSYFGGGTLLFAGDIHVGGACWDMSTRGTRIFFAHPLTLDCDTAVAEAMMMTPDGTRSEVVRAAMARETIERHHLWTAEGWGWADYRGGRGVGARIQRVLDAALVKSPQEMGRGGHHR